MVRTIIINHKVYGKIAITDSVIIELIKSKSMQRLKGIAQGGHFTPYFPDRTETRFEHSIGVYYLLNKFGASIEEQVAGLIHDVSHFAFSHCVDYVIKSGSHEINYQDTIHDKFVRSSEIAGIITKYGFNLNYILDESNFPLKERELPDLCADRIDYILLAAVTYGVISKKKVKYFLSGFKIISKQWVFKDKKRAKYFADLFKYVNDTYFADLISAVVFTTVSDYLKYAIEQKYINFKELHTTDQEVLDKIAPYHHKDQKLVELFLRMDGKVKFENNPDDFDQEAFCKNRLVDPLYLQGEKVVRLSQTDKKWFDIISLSSKSTQYFIKFFK